MFQTVKPKTPIGRVSPKPKLPVKPLPKAHAKAASSRGPGTKPSAPKQSTVSSQNLLENLQELITQINQAQGLKDQTIKISFNNKNDIVVNI